MKIAIFYGSNRTDRQGIKAAKFVQKKLRERHHDVTLIDSKEYPLPFLDKMYKEYKNNDAPKIMQKIHNILVESDGFVIVSGEYNHSIPAVLKNMLDTFQSEYFFKPSAIVGLSAGTFGGVRVADHLRIVLAELGMPAISSSFAISVVQDNFDNQGNAIDKHYDKRIILFLKEFEWYLSAFKNQRQQGTPY